MLHWYVCRHREHPFCLCCRQRHDTSAESQGVQPRVMIWLTLPCVDVTMTVTSMTSWQRRHCHRHRRRVSTWPSSLHCWHLVTSRFLFPFHAKRFLCDCSRNVVVETSVSIRWSVVLTPRRSESWLCPFPTCCIKIFALQCEWWLQAKSKILLTRAGVWN